MSTQKLLLGAHMSIGGGLYKALERGASIGCSAIGIFTSSNRQWNTKSLDPASIEQFIVTQKHLKIRCVVAHASYLINLCSENSDVIHKSKQALRSELERADLLQIPYLVLHPGSAGTQTEETALTKIAQGINEVLSSTQSKTMILLENMAGQGSIVGHTFEQLKHIYHLIDDKKQIGFCFDTCHAFAAGYDFSNPASYKAMWNHFDATLGLRNLKALHMNDSKKALGSHVDRHEEIGKGLISLEAFKLLINDKNLIHIPKILETPRDTEEDYAKNLKVLIELLDKHNLQTIKDENLEEYLK